jgi:hypothetical protein
MYVLHIFKCACCNSCRERRRPSCSHCSIHLSFARRRIFCRVCVKTAGRRQVPSEVMELKNTCMISMRSTYLMHSVTPLSDQPCVGGWFTKPPQFPCERTCVNTKNPQQRLEPPALLAALLVTLRSVLNMGFRLVLVYPVPEPGDYPLNILRARERDKIPGEYVNNASEFIARTAVIFDKLDTLKSANGGALDGHTMRMPDLTSSIMLTYQCSPTSAHPAPRFIAARLPASLPMQRQCVSSVQAHVHEHGTPVYGRPISTILPRRVSPKCAWHD